MVYLKKDKDMIRRAAWVFIVFAIILTFTSSPVDAALSRDNAVANMKKQATVGWSTQKDVTIYYTPKVSSKTYYKGTSLKMCLMYGFLFLIWEEAFTLTVINRGPDSRNSLPEYFIRHKIHLIWV